MVIDEMKDLNTEELLKGVLSPKVVSNLVEEYGDGLISSIINSSYKELTKLVGKVGAKKIKCLAEIFRRIGLEKSGNISKITAPLDVMTCMCDMNTLQQEELRVIILDTKNNILKVKAVSKGTVRASITTPREVLAPAIKEYAASIILVHNHPSGDPSPSICDFELTEKMVKSGELVGINVLDHVIIGGNNYYSMKHEGHI